MTARERVLAAINHKIPDRIPIDLGGMRSTGIMAVAYQKLKDYLKITDGELLIFDSGQQLAFVEEPIRKKFGCDVVILDEGLLQGWRPYQILDGTFAKITKRSKTSLH